MEVSNSGSSPKKHILVADDDPTALKFYTRLLTLNGFQVTAVNDGRKAREFLDTGKVDVVLSDIGMPHLNGIQLLQSVGSSDQNPPVVLITGNPQVETAVQAVQGRALDYLTKPVDSQRLLNAIHDAVRVSELARARRNVMTLVDHPGREAAPHGDLSASFDRALETLWMAFQPIVSVSARRAFAYEALVRNEEKPLMPPPDLLSAAETLGRLPDLGRRIRAAVARRAGDIPQGVFIFVNLHPRDLEDESILSPKEPLSAHASRVVLEITERSSLTEVPNLERKLNTLRRMGYRFALDDLGAGYAGLNAFVDLNPDVVKLDMALIRGIHKHEVKRRLVESITVACRDLRKQIVAEGIEEAAERDVVAGMGIDLLQGYAFGKPAREVKEPEPGSFL